MNYYEELGIPRDATTDEIREAYKLLARLLHPDKQREPRLKDMAECQMKRLGEVVAVLLNPQERARYDVGLSGGVLLGPPAPLAPASGPGLLQNVVRNWFWVLLGSVTISMGVWYELGRGPVAPPGSDALEGARVPTGPVARHSDRAQGKKREVKPAEPSAQTPTDSSSKISSKAPGASIAELPLGHPEGEEPEPGLSAAAPTEEVPVKAAKEKQKGVPAVAKAGPADVPRPGGESRFAGEWLSSANEREGGLAGRYPATYVEFRLREESGILAGDYRALHKVADRAISPEVAFRVRGESPSGNTGKLGWESSAGAKGEVELTLLLPNQLQVKWWTTQFGRRESLSSGLAVLMRQKAP
jgi:hypothetical protein